MARPRKEMKAVNITVGMNPETGKLQLTTEAATLPVQIVEKMLQSVQEELDKDMRTAARITATKIAKEMWFYRIALTVLAILLIAIMVK